VKQNFLQIFSNFNFRK